MKSIKPTRATLFILLVGSGLAIASLAAFAQPQQGYNQGYGQPQQYGQPYGQPQQGYGQYQQPVVVVQQQQPQDFCTYAASQIVMAAQQSRGSAQALNKSPTYAALMQHPQRPSRVVVPTLMQVATDDLMNEAGFRVYDDVKNKCYAQINGLPN